MHANVDTQLVETRKNCVYFFFQSKLNWVSTWAPNWEYSSEHNGAYGLAASHPITFIILTLLLQYVLWNRPGAKEDLSESLDVHQGIRQSLCEEETLGLARWEMEEYCKQKEQPECRSFLLPCLPSSEAGRYLVNRKPASLTGTQGTKRGDAR